LTFDVLKVWHISKKAVRKRSLICHDVAGVFCTIVFEFAIVRPRCFYALKKIGCRPDNCPLRLVPILVGGTERPTYLLNKLACIAKYVVDSNGDERRIVYAFQKLGLVKPISDSYILVVGLCCSNALVTATCVIVLVDPVVYYQCSISRRAKRKSRAALGPRADPQRVCEGGACPLC